MHNISITCNLIQSFSWKMFFTLLSKQSKPPFNLVPRVSNLFFIFDKVFFILASSLSLKSWFWVPFFIKRANSWFRAVLSSSVSTRTSRGLRTLTLLHCFTVVLASLFSWTDWGGCPDSTALSSSSFWLNSLSIACNLAIRSEVGFAEVSTLHSPARKTTDTANRAKTEVFIFTVQTTMLHLCLQKQYENWYLLHVLWST